MKIKQLSAIIIGVIGCAIGIGVFVNSLFLSSPEVSSTSEKETPFKKETPSKKETPQKKLQHENTTTKTVAFRPENQRTASQKAAIQQWAKLQTPFLKKNCVSCHGSKKTEGNLRLDTVQFDLFDGPTREIWESILTRLSEGEMPPEEAPQHPSVKEKATFIARLKKEMHAADQLAQAGGTLLRRLNREEYLNSIQSIFNIRGLALPSSFPPDISELEFDTIPDGTFLSPSLFKSYLDFATEVADAVVPLSQEQISLPADSKSLEMKSNKTGAPVKNAFSGVNSSPWSGGMWHPLFIAHKPGLYRLKLRTKALGTKGADGKPLRLVFHAMNPNNTITVSHYRAPRFKYPQVASVDITNLQEKFIEVDVPIEKGEAIYVYCGNRLPKGTFPDQAGPKQQLDSLCRKYRRKAEFPSIQLLSMGITGPVGLMDRQKDFLQNQKLEATESCLRKLLLPIVEKAYRRPLTQQEETNFINDLLTHAKTAPSVKHVLHYGIRLLLCSPEFLYHNSKKTPEGELTNYSLASRLSYALWTDSPDQELLDLAKKGTLTQKNVLEKQVRRLLASPKSQKFIEHFTGQWLGNRKVKSQMVCDVKHQWGATAQYSYYKITELFFEEILRKNLPINNFIDSDFTYISKPSQMANGILKGKSIHDFEKGYRHSGELPTLYRVEFDHYQPLSGSDPTAASTVKKMGGGLLGLPGIYLATSDGVNSSPILRGVWVLKNLFGIDIPDPPDDVPDIQDVEGVHKSIRATIEAHTKDPKCASCHRKIDPLGLALENFDAVGKWRDKYPVQKTEKNDRETATGKKPKKEKKKKKTKGKGKGNENKNLVESSVTLHTGEKISGVSGLRKHLLKNSSIFTKCLTKKLTIYMTGRHLSVGDRKVIDEIVQQESKSGYKFQDLIVKVIQSKAFLRK